MTKRLEIDAAIAISAFAMYQMSTQYTSIAPKLSELRDSDSDSLSRRQQLLDADLLVGGIAILAGITASVLSRSFVPLVTALIGFGWLSYWHHAVQAAPPVSDDNV